MKNAMKYLILVGFLLLTCLEVNAQKKLKKLPKTQQIFVLDQMYVVKMRNESTIIGKYVGMEGDFYVFQSDVSRLQIAGQDIQSSKTITTNQVKEGKYWFSNPHASRYLFGPSAFNLKKKESYLQSTYGLVNTYNYGLTDHFTLGGGTEIISLLSGSPVIIITPKFGGYKIADKWHVGGGALGAIFLSSSEFDDPFGGGILYGIATRGTEDHNLTFGGGVGFGGDEFEFGYVPIFTLSGMIRISKNFGLVSENWIFKTDENFNSILSFGVRFFGEKMSVDLALINFVDSSTDDFPIFLPFIDFVYKF